MLPIQLSFKCLPCNGENDYYSQKFYKNPTQCPIRNLKLHMTGEKKYQEDVDTAMAKREKNGKAIKVNSAYANKGSFSGRTVRLLLKVECHQTRQSPFNIIEVIHSSFISTEAQSQSC